MLTFFVWLERILSKPTSQIEVRHEVLKNMPGSIGEVPETEPLPISCHHSSVSRVRTESERYLGLFSARSLTRP